MVVLIWRDTERREREKGSNKWGEGGSSTRRWRVDRGLFTFSV